MDYGQYKDAVVAEWVTDPETGKWAGPFTFTVVVRPGNAEEVRKRVRMSYDGALCVVERDAPSRSKLKQIHEEITAEVVEDQTRFGGHLSSHVDERRSIVVLNVVLASDEVRSEARRRWGDLVEINDALRPVS